MKSAARKKQPASYRRRTYRRLVEHGDLISSHVRIKETDLQLLAAADVTEAAGELAAAARLQVERYIDGCPAFATALTPLPEDELAPPIIRRMLRAGRIAGVGPMASVAGGVAEFVGCGLLEAGHEEIVVENGGDIFINRSVAVTVGVFAGRSPLSQRLAIMLEPDRMPVGICTSSATVGHSLSFGRADSVTVLADSAAVADAVATRLGNETADPAGPRAGVDRALGAAARIEAVRGVLVICGETIGAVGDIELAPLPRNRS